MNTPRDTLIQFDTAKFNEEIAKCRASQMAALWDVAGAIFKKRYGVGLDAPPELLRLALGKTDVTKCMEEIVEIRRNQNSALTNEHWQKLFKNILELAERSGPMSDEELKQAMEDYRNDIALIQRWVAVPNHPDPIRASLCFYTWEAMAKIVYNLDWKTPVPLERQKAGSGHRSIEAERVKGHCRRLGLVQSELRLIKDVEIRPNGDIKFVPFDQYLPSE